MEHLKLNTDEQCCGAQGKANRSTACKAQEGILLHVASEAWGKHWDPPVLYRRDVGLLGRTQGAEWSELHQTRHRRDSWKQVWKRINLRSTKTRRDTTLLTEQRIVARKVQLSYRGNKTLCWQSQRGAVIAQAGCRPAVRRDECVREHAGKHTWHSSTSCFEGEGTTYFKTLLHPLTTILVRAKFLRHFNIAHRVR